MRIAVLREQAEGERRVAATPETVRKFVALGATLLSVASGAGSARHDAAGIAASAWRGLVGAPRQEVALGQRVIVVLKTPALADQVARAGGRATEQQQRQWTTASLAASHQLIAKLAQHGGELQRVAPQLRVGQPEVTEHDGGAVGVADGGLRQDAGDRQGHGCGLQVRGVGRRSGSHGCDADHGCRSQAQVTSVPAHAAGGHPGEG